MQISNLRAKAAKSLQYSWLLQKSSIVNKSVNIAMSICDLLIGYLHIYILNETNIYFRLDYKSLTSTWKIMNFAEKVMTSKKQND